MSKHPKKITDLLAWQRARIFRNKMRLLVKTFPPEEKYDLTQQLRRSSRAVCSALAEGHGRYHYQEYNQSCRVARGELVESFNHLTDALDSGYISEHSKSMTKKLMK